MESEGAIAPATVRPPVYLSQTQHNTSALIPLLLWGDTVAQLVERRTQDPRDWGSNHVRSTKNKFVSFSKSKMCWLAVSVPNPRVYTHAQEWSRTHIKCPAVHVSLVDYVNGNSTVMICTLSSAHWQQASKLSALKHFELIWKDWEKCTYQYNNNNNNNNNNTVAYKWLTHVTD